MADELVVAGKGRIAEFQGAGLAQRGAEMTFAQEALHAGERHLCIGFFWNGMKWRRIGVEEGLTYDWRCLDAAKNSRFHRPRLPISPGCLRLGRHKVVLSPLEPRYRSIDETKALLTEQSFSVVPPSPVTGTRQRPDLPLRPRYSADNQGVKGVLGAQGAA